MNKFGITVFLAILSTSATAEGISEFVCKTSTGYINRPEDNATKAAAWARIGVAGIPVSEELVFTFKRIGDRWNAAGNNGQDSRLTTAVPMRLSRPVDIVSNRGLPPWHQVEMKCAHTRQSVSLLSP
jgi:hypothetical protein